jgi:hypothetical protein
MATRKIQVGLSITDASPELVRTGQAGVSAGQSLEYVESASDEARRGLTDLIREAGKLDRATSEVKKLERAGHDLDEALHLVGTVRGVEIGKLSARIRPAVGALDDVGDAAKRAELDVAAIRSGAEKVFGPMVGDVLDVGGALGAIGPAAGTATAGLLAMAAGTAVVVGTTVAIVSLVAATEDWLAHIDELELAELVTAEQRAALEGAHDALEGVRVAGEGAGVALGALFADDVAKGALVVAGAVLEIRDALASVGGLSGAASASVRGGISGIANALIGPTAGAAAGALYDGAVKLLEPVLDDLEDRGAQFAGDVSDAADRIGAAADKLTTASKSARTIGSASDIQFGAGASGFSATEILPPSMAADIRELAAASAELDGLLRARLTGEADLAATYAEAAATAERLGAVTGDTAAANLLLTDALTAYGDGLTALAVTAQEQAKALTTAKGLALVGAVGDPARAATAALGSAGPAGAIAAAALELGPDFGTTAADSADKLLATVENLPENLGMVIGEVIPDLLTGLISAIPDLLIGLPVAIAEALVGLPVRLLGKVAEGPIGRANAFFDALASGGTSVDATAAAINAGRGAGDTPTQRAARRQRGRGGPVIVQAAVVSPDVWRSMDRQMRTRRGPRGTGLDYGSG